MAHHPRAHRLYLGSISLIPFRRTLPMIPFTEPLQNTPCNHHINHPHARIHANMYAHAYIIHAYTCIYTHAHIHTYTHTHITRTPNKSIKNTSPKIQYQLSLKTPCHCNCPLLFFLFIAFDYFSRSERALQTKLSGNLLTSSFACKTRRQQAAKVIKRVYVCFVSKWIHENAKANRMKQANERETGEDERRFICEGHEPK